ncbi:hypothetical protein NESM_000372000 [Novymonas esmeraldas]|uniref:RecQ-mediated genome instability protein 1 n=1 Tax=Novymonas esmeraldas TaxID=1808958 RepID=A0AAW0EMQ9_9TRYP
MAAGGTDTATAEYIRRHLDEDLEEVARRPGAPAAIRSSLAPYVTSTGMLSLAGGGSPAPVPTQLIFLLQVMSIKDVSLTREQRSRALAHALSTSATDGVVDSAGDDVDGHTGASLVDATLQAMEEQQEELALQHTPLRPSGGQWRCLRVELSDGFQRVLAVEDASARTRQRCGGGVLAAEGLSLGAKLEVCLPTDPATVAASVQHGILRLHTGNTTVVGGRVRALEVYWAAQARQQLAASTGQPSKQAPPLQAAQPPPTSSPSSSPAAPPTQPLRCWPAHATNHPPQTPFITVAFITAVVSDMVLHEQPTAIHGAPTTDTSGEEAHGTYSLLVQLSSPNAVERETQLSHNSSAAAEDVWQVCDADHLTVDLGHAWLRRLVAMPADTFRALSLSTAPADVVRLTRTVEAVGLALEQCGRLRLTLVRRASDDVVEVLSAVPDL